MVACGTVRYVAGRRGGRRPGASPVAAARRAGCRRSASATPARSARAVGDLRAARVEAAAARDAGRVGDLAGEHDRLELLDLGDDGQQRLRVGVPRAAQHLLGGAALDDAAEVHHRDPVGDVPGQAEVVGHHDDAQPEVGAQLEQQREDLAADRGVEGGDRLVGDDQRPAAAPARRRSARAASGRPTARAGSAGTAAPAAAGRPRPWRPTTSSASLRPCSSEATRRCSRMPSATDS